MPQDTQPWGSPDPGSGAAVDGVFNGKRQPVKQKAALNVKAMLNAGHGVSMARQRTNGKKRGGRKYGAAQNPRGLPYVIDIYSGKKRLRLAARQPKNGIIGRDRMLDMMNRAGLTDTERVILKERLGLGWRGKRITQRELADMRDVSQPAIAKSEKNARQKVREVLEGEGFKGFERHVAA